MTAAPPTGAPVPLIPLSDARGRRRQLVGLLLRLLAAIALVWSIAGPLGEPLVHALVPAQRAVYGALLPDFAVSRFQLVHKGGSLKLSAVVLSQHYLVLRGQAVPPNVSFSAETPARAALAYLALIGAGGLLLLHGRRAWLGAAVALGGAALLMLLLPAITLAGAQWAVVVPPFSEPSVAAVLGGASDLLLHGGGYGLSAAVLLLAKLAAGVTRRSV